MSEEHTSEVKSLARNYGLITTTAIVVANMIGSGIFITSGQMAANLPGPLWVLGCWLFGGLIALSGALCYAELATRMPEAGGEYVYLKKLYHPSLGFLTGWTSFFVGFSAPIALSALGFIEYFALGVLNRFTGLDPGTVHIAKKTGAIILILIFTALHYIGHNLGGKVQNALTSLKIIIILGLSCAGLLLGSGSWANLSTHTHLDLGGFALAPAMIMVMFAYSGWNASAYIAGEVKRPRRTLPVSLAVGTGVVILLYLFINLFYFYAAPYQELRGVVAVAEVASIKAFGGWLSDVLSGMIGIAMLSSLSAFILIGPRVYYAMAKDQLFFPFAGKIHTRFGVPSQAILIQGIIAVLMVIIGSIEQLLIYVGFALGIFPWLAIVGLFVARKRKIGEETVVKTSGYPWIPAFYLLSSLVLMVFVYIDRPQESTAAILTVAAGIPIYYLWIKGAKKVSG